MSFFKGNPFRKFLTKENLFHEAVITYFKVQHPKIFITHHPNESKKTAFERFLYKILGVKTGIPDILIFTPRKGFNGLAIELKIKPNKPSTIQNECMNELKACNWRVEVAYDINEVIAISKEYFNLF